MGCVWEDVFEYHYWEDEELLFAMVLDRKKERVLVGSERGILEHLRNDGAVQKVFSVERRKEREREAALVVAGRDLMQTVREIPQIGFRAATRKEQDRIRFRAEAYIPLVCDRSFKIGHFLTSFEWDLNREWEGVVACLSAALQGSRSTMERDEEQAKGTLRKKWKSNDPVCQFTALRIWMDYCAVRRLREEEETALVFHGSGDDYLQKVKGFADRSMKLVEAFFQPFPQEEPFGSKKLEVTAPLLRLPADTGEMEGKLRILLVKGTEIQCVLLDETFYLLKTYYAQKMNEYGVRIGKCLQCGGYFADPTGKRKTCGPRCAQGRKRDTTHAYRTEGGRSTLAKKRSSEYQFWYNRIRKAESIEGFPPDWLEELKSAFEAYKVGFQKQKKKLKKGEIAIQDLNNWVEQQKSIAINLMGEYEGRCQKKRQQSIEGVE